MKKPVVSIIMGSDSDLSVMQDAIKILEEFSVPHEVLVISAHRTPDKMTEYAKTAHKRGIKVIIAGAGGAAHLGGVAAASTPLPVIGVPIITKSLEGLDSLLSMAQMPPGVPVATVAINGAKNAGILAAQILATSDSGLLKKIQEYKETMRVTVEEKSEKLLGIGYKQYLGVKENNV